MSNTRDHRTVGRRRAARVVGAVMLAMAMPPSSAGGQGAIADAIERRDFIGAERPDYPRYRATLIELYAATGGRPVWTRGVTATSAAGQVIAQLERADERGLRAKDYDAVPLRGEVARVASGTGDARLARFDAAVSLATARFLDHLHRGRVDPGTLGMHLHAEDEGVNLAPLLLAMATTERLDSLILSVEPRSARYAALVATLSRYRAFVAAGVSPPDLPRRTVRPGDSLPGAERLREFLRALGDGESVVDRGNAAFAIVDVYDAALVAAVQSFQRRHGLEPDGVIGPATGRMLRVPLDRRVEQLELTLERWRWLPERLPPRLAIVNIPAFRLYLLDSAQAGEVPAVRMDVIVGQAYAGRRTPIFIDTMELVVFRPYWDVPPSIARKELVPLLRRNPGLAARDGYEIVRLRDDPGPARAPTAQNLTRVAEGALRIRQRPGPANALGAVKFVLPNPYNVYLHDTPAEELFERSRRDFSHGCIRVSDPARLAEFVLTPDTAWGRARIAQAMVGTRMLTVRVGAPLPVYIVYATAMIGDRGEVRFYEDLYGHDAALRRALGPREPLTPLARR